ncbi:MAG: hypothetical protein K0Q76_3718 [Panacagrimonas sp.]|jgi:hypothetical protein|nr:hypothetical protein [Panacagrimonas sp.]MCC2658610.1 hypothetical protein [Panacagrimonas sp.]
MKPISRVSPRDLTGLACAAGMGLLVLLAWATLPGLPRALDPAGTPAPSAAALAPTPLIP